MSTRTASASAGGVMSAPAISSRVLGVMWGAPSLGFLGRPIIARRGGAEQCHGRVFSFNETYRMVCFANEPFPSAQEAAGTRPQQPYRLRDPASGRDGGRGRRDQGGRRGRP